VQARIALNSLFRKRLRHNGLGNFGLDPWWDDELKFIPGVAPLSRPATPGDVAAGKAIFHLAGKGRLADIKLPATAVFRKEKEAYERKEAAGLIGLFGPDEPGRVLIVQAEFDADGQLHYGIIAQREIREANADELADIEPLDSTAVSRPAG